MGGRAVATGIGDRRHCIPMRIPPPPGPCADLWPQQWPTTGAPTLNPPRNRPRANRLLVCEGCLWWCTQRRRLGVWVLTTGPGPAKSGPARSDGWQWRPLHPQAGCATHPPPRPAPKRGQFCVEIFLFRRRRRRRGGRVRSSIAPLPIFHPEHRPRAPALVPPLLTNRIAPIPPFAAVVPAPSTALHPHPLACCACRHGAQHPDRASRD